MQQLEDGAAAGDGDAPSALAQNLNRLFQEVALLDRVVDALPADRGRDDVWRKRAAQLGAEAMAQRQSVERFLKTSFAARQEQRERGLLLGGAAVRAAARRGRGARACTRQARAGGRAQRPERGAHSFHAPPSAPSTSPRRYRRRARTPSQSTPSCRSARRSSRRTQ